VAHALSSMLPSAAKRYEGRGTVGHQALLTKGGWCHGDWMHTHQKRMHTDELLKVILHIQNPKLFFSFSIYTFVTL